MVHVIAAIQVKPGCMEAFLKKFRRNVPNVLAEAGCLAYQPAIDVASGLKSQAPLRKDVVTIVEAWESLEALAAHLQTPHMLAYKEEVKGIVESVSFHVLQPA